METEIIEVMEVIEELPIFELNTVLAVIVMVYIAFQLYFMLEKFKVKD